MYVSTLRAKLACAAVLLVVAPDPAVAAWARQPIDLGIRESLPAWGPTSSALRGTIRCISLGNAVMRARDN